MQTKLVRILVVMTILLVASLACSTGDGLGQGSEAPDFILTSSAGKEIRLTAFRGRPVLLNFFTTWCGPCRAEMPGMQKMYAKYYSQGLVLIAVDQGDLPADVREYAIDLKLGFPLLLDEKTKVGDLYGVNAYPRTYFIDTDGVIQRVTTGSMQESEIEDGIKDLLRMAREAKEKKPAVENSSGVEGCININAANARIGPGKKYQTGVKLNHAECVGFDARTADGAWLRMTDILSAQGDRLWVQAEFVDLKADVMTLPIQ